VGARLLSVGPTPLEQAAPGDGRPSRFLQNSPEDIRSNLLIAHARGESREPRINDNTQPFRFRSWAFCHVGTLAAFDQIGDGLRSSIPDFMRRNIHGSTDSEVFVSSPSCISE
jgi:predicted glutamine amidotransferase